MVATQKQTYGPRFAGDTSYPLSPEEQRVFLDERIGFFKDVTEEQKKLLIESIKTTFETPAGRSAVRTAINSGETFFFTVKDLENASMAAHENLHPAIQGRIYIDPDTFKQLPESIGATALHETMHIQQYAFINFFRSEVSNDAPTQAFSSQMALETFHRTKGKTNIGFDHVYQDVFDQEFKACYQYACNPGAEPPEGMEKFEPTGNVSGKELDEVRRAYAHQMAATRAMKRFEDTFRTPLEDWRPGTHIMSLDIAETQEVYRDNASSLEAENYSNINKLFYTLSSNKNIGLPTNVNLLTTCAQKEAAAVGENTPLGKALLRAAQKLGRKKQRLSPQDIAVLRYATGKHLSNLDEHHRNAIIISAAKIFDTEPRKRDKATDAVRDQLMLETQKVTGNPYLTPTRTQRQAMERGEPLTLASNSPKEGVDAKPTTLATLDTSQEKGPVSEGERVPQRRLDIVQTV